MDLMQAIPFAFGGLILLWAAASAAMAFSGGQSSGLHEIAPAPRAPSAEERRRVEARGLRREQQAAQIANYLLGFAVLGALCLLIVASLFA